MNHLFKTAFENLKTYSFTTVLNLAGLTTAFSAFILIMLYVWNEHHYNDYHKNKAGIYRVESQNPNEAKSSVFLFGPTGETLVREIPEVLKSTFYLPDGKWGEGLFKWNSGNTETKSFEDYAFSDEKLTDIFTFHFIRGNKTNPLLEPQSAIVSESFAQRAWGTGDPTGKQLILNGESYTIMAVFQDIPDNTVIRCPIILKFPTGGYRAEAAKGWGMYDFPQFILVKPGTDPDELNRKINALPLIKEKYNSFVKGDIPVNLIARPLKDLRFSSETAETPLFSSNSKMFVISLLWVGVLIILVAFFNYINFATANVPKRIKSLSVRRVLGSSRGNSIAVLLSETVSLFFISYGMALLISFFLNKAFSLRILGYTLPFTENFLLMILCGTGLLLAAILTGLYPAFYTTAGKPVESLKKYIPKSNINLRGIMTVSQFATTIALIVASIVVMKQVRYMEETDLGFSKESTLVIRMNDDVRKNSKLFRSRMESNPYIKGVAFSRAVPGQAQESKIVNVNGKSCAFFNWAVDDRYIEMMGFEIVQGRNFFKDSEADYGKMICNETAAKKYGWAPGTKIDNTEIVGVMKDFNFISLRDEVEPFVFWRSGSADFFGCISIKLSTEEMSSAIASIKKVYDEISPEIPMQYYFIDNQLDVLYTKENQQAGLIIGFCFISIIVSILGILGFSTFMCQRRVKEIGIRKVSGARISEVLILLNTDFVKWVILAFVLATPAAWYIMNAWLRDFAYQTTLSWWIFVLSGALALGIALLTVSWQSWKAATRNPVEALRYE
ncbi:MAG: ABC transporter permease [Bacteroidales bacterium]|nr:ABC transporter permease [Bacteroidales bacterium]